MNHLSLLLQFLTRNGFTLATTRARQTLTIEQIQNNLYGYLDDFAPLNFRFIRYPDQAVTATETATGQAFECFGRCELGALASDGQGRVWLLVRDRESFEGRARVFANATRAGSFWAHLVYLIEDDFFYYRLPLSQYMEEGRWGG